MRGFFSKRLIRHSYLAVSLTLFLLPASCQKKSSAAASPTPSLPEDHFVGTWKLNKDKTPVFAPRYNPMPVYEWIVISANGDLFTLVFSHQSDKPSEGDRVLVGDMKTPGVGVDALNGKLTVFPAYIQRIDPDSFIHGGGISEEEYRVLPDWKTMRVRQQPFVDNGFARELVYDKVASSDVTPFPRF